MALDQDQKERRAGMAGDMETWRLLSAVADLYYHAELTQNQIADRLYTSRSKISRMLKEARDLGIVEIRIHEPWERNFMLEQQIQKRFSLTYVRIVTARETDSEKVLKKLGEAAAYRLDGVIKRNAVLGISWGNTVYQTVRSINTNKNIPITVVPIMGGANIRRPERDSLDLSKELAASYGGKYQYIYAPLFVKTKELRESLMQEPGIWDVISLAKRADIILTSVGSIAYKTWKDYIQPHALECLARKGAVGHMGGHFYDINGKEVHTDLAERMVGIGLADIKKTKEVICVAGLKEKAEALLGALRGGYVDALITDELAAEKILSLDGEK